MGNDSRLRRSQLATPGSDPEMVEHAPTTGADEAILDLEDAVAPDEKADARQTVIEGFIKGDWSETLACYRINGVDTRWWYDDVIKVVSDAGEYIDTVMVPKTRNIGTIATVDNLLTQVEVNNDLPVGEIGLQCQIETAEGMNNVVEIARAADRLESLVFGPGDYAAAVGAGGLPVGSDEDYPGHRWHYHLSRLVHAAKADGLQVIDGPYGEIDDFDGFRDSCRHASSLGCDGKWTVHPVQIPPANEVFTPSDEEAAMAQHIVEEYQQAMDEGKGAVSIEGEMVDEATHRMARNIVRRAEQVGKL